MLPQRHIEAVPDETRDGDEDIHLRDMFEGDIVVTRVARHYSLGRMNADRQTQTPIEVQIGRADALTRARLLADADHRIFLYEQAGPCAGIHIKRLEPFGRPDGVISKAFRGNGGGMPPPANRRAVGPPAQSANPARLRRMTLRRKDDNEHRLSRPRGLPTPGSKDPVQG
jgi:hypothetical protein